MSSLAAAARKRANPESAASDHGLVERLANQLSSEQELRRDAESRALHAAGDGRINESELNRFFRENPGVASTVSTEERRLVLALSRVQFDTVMKHWRKAIAVEASQRHATAGSFLVRTAREKAAKGEFVGDVGGGHMLPSA